MHAAVMIAATPRPAPSPAARPVLDLFGLEAGEVADAEVEAAGVGPALVPVDRTLSLLLVEVPVLVLVPILCNAETLNAELVATNPGHVVLPITVTVVGGSAPSLMAFFPVLQLHSESPGQQYQSAPLDAGHFARGMEVLESV
jgi:hypothetical protein